MAQHPSHPEFGLLKNALDDTQLQKQAVETEGVVRQALIDDTKDAEKHNSPKTPADTPPKNLSQLEQKRRAIPEVKKGSSQLTSGNTGQAQQTVERKTAPLDKSSEMKKEKIEADQNDFVEFKIKSKNEVSQMTLDDWFKTVQSKTPDLFVTLTFSSFDELKPVEILLDSATIKQRVQAFDGSQRNVLLKKVLDSLAVKGTDFDPDHIKAMCNFAYRCIEGKKLALSALTLEPQLFSHSRKKNIFKCAVTLKSTVAKCPQAKALWEQLKQLPPLYPTLDEQNKPLALVYGNTAASHDIYVFFNDPPDYLRPFNINPVKLANPVDDAQAVCYDALRHIYVANNAHVSFGSLSEGDKKTYNEQAVKMDFQDFKLQDTSIPLSLRTYTYDKQKLCVFSPKQGVFNRVSEKVLRFVSILADTQLHWKQNAPKVKSTASFAKEP